MKILNLFLVTIIIFNVTIIQASDLYLLSSVTDALSLNQANRGILVLARPAGFTGGVTLLKFSPESSPEIFFETEFDQRDKGVISDVDSPVCMVRTSDGGFAVLAELKPYKAAQAGINREAAIWLLKLSSSGKQEWEKVISENAYGCKPFNVIQTKDNGYIITGATMKGNVWKSLVIKTDAAGSVVWKKSFPSASYAFFDSAVELSDGKFVLYGYDEVQNRTNYWIAGIDANGNKLWQKTWPGMGEQLKKPLIHLHEDSFYALIKSDNSIPGLLTFKSAGTIASDIPIKGMKTPDMLNDNILLNDGSITFCGWTQNKTQDILIQKIGAGNILQWRKAIDIEGDDLGLFVLKTQDQGYLLIAATNYAYDYSTTDYTYTNMIIQIDENGNKLWSEPFTVGKNDYISDAVITEDNRCIILITTIRNAKQEVMLLVTEPGGHIGKITGK
ncbi:MAG: hypothetical protein JW982_01955 [Spirochaetes bacterium]|nr:hypothetical protein [Spirochaetota bacterium]